MRPCSAVRKERCRERLGGKHEHRNRPVSDRAKLGHVSAEGSIGQERRCRDNIPLLSLRLDLSVPQPSPDPLVVYICDVAILAVFKRAKGVTGDQKVRVICAYNQLSNFGAVSLHN